MDNVIKDLEPFFGSWYLVELIGEGSFGKVYKIRRDVLGEDQYSALKVIRIPQSQAEVEQAYREGMDDESATSYFESFVQDITREIKMMDALKGNTNIVGYEDHQIIRNEDSIGWTILIRMELLTSLNKYSAKNALSQKQVAELGVDICKALELCNKENIIHRDIKPDNIFISKNGDYKLGDFGIARKLEKTVASLSKKGTYTYMAPEVYRGNPYDSTVDIYSLGIVMYKLLNRNRAPFLPPAPAPITFQDREASQHKQMTGESMPPPQDAVEKFAQIVLKACAFNPKDRYASPVQMRDALAKLIVELTDDNVFNAPLVFAAAASSQRVDKKKEPTTDSIWGDTDDGDDKSKAGTVGIFTEVVDGENSMTGAALTPTTAEFTDNTVKGVAENTQGQSEKDIKKSRKKPTFVVIIAAALVLLIALSAYGVNRLSQSKDTADGSTTVKVIEMAAVPDVVGMTSDDALKLLAEHGFNGEITQLYDEKVAAGIVISQKSAAGEKLQKGTAVELVVSLGKETQTVPDLTGKTAQAASDALQAMGFVFASKTQVDDSKPAGMVIGQSVAAGKQLKIGETVTVTICVGSSKVAVPDLVGKTASEAEAALKKAGLAYSSTNRFSDEVKSGVVISQNKPAGSQLAKGTVVEFVVSKGIDYRVVPYMVGKTLADAQSALNEVGLKSDITEQYSDTVASGMVISQSIKAGEELAAGSTVNIVVSKGSSTWSPWVASLPSGVTSANYEIQNKSQYRYRDKETKTSYESSLAGWTLLSSAWESTPYEKNLSFEYANFQLPDPNEFNTSHPLYTKYNKAPVTSSTTETIKTVASTSSTGKYIYWHWCRGGTSPRNFRDDFVWESSGWHEVIGQGWFNFTTFHAFESSGSAWQPGGTFGDLYSAGYNQPMDTWNICNRSWFWVTPRISIRKCTYSRTRKVFTYYRWKEWTPWQDAPVTATSDRQVDAPRTVYRYRAK